MQKGQLSFDALFAGVALIIFLASLTTVSSYIYEAEKSKVIRAQERQIIAGINEITTTTLALKDSSPGTKVRYLVPKLFVPGEAEKQGCRITLNTATNDISLATTFTGTTQVEEKSKIVFDTATFIYRQAGCGSMFEIEKK